ncbi:endonuclease/exonuclease/phosphatase family protein [Pseudoalteromonas fenneropenaei]|uniref:Endonuclease/exonuclease/phosphatase family protein n=1 Tax=Pseudoalteromonas fenneropenaei TaxID=1737459 RepID=A0ABV7CFD3_9GAMM
MVSSTRYCIATFNLLNFAAPPMSFYQLHEHYNDTQWLTKIQFLTGLIEHINPTIIAFQEVFSIQTLQLLCEDLGLPYFATVATPRPDPIYPNVLFHPVVAIASKVPFRTAQALEPSPELLEYLNNQHHFEFNRTPIKCTFDLPGFGPLSCYAVHFKSQRVHSMAHMLKDSPQDDPLLTLLHQTVGTMQSQISRSLEASIVYYHALKCQREKQHATLVLGDFNDQLTSPALSFMTQSFPPAVTPTHPESVGLTDTFLFADNNHKYPTKPPSHYYQGSGNVLDYILASKEFNPNCEQPKIRGLNYLSFDKHLDVTRSDEDIRYSDHAAVAIEFFV